MIQDYLFKMLADRRTRLFVTLVLLAMLAYQLSISIWQFYEAPNSAASDYRSQVIVANISARPEQSFLEKAQVISRAYSCQEILNERISNGECRIKEFFSIY